MEEWADEEEPTTENKDADTTQIAQSETKDHTDSADHETPQASPRRSEENYDADGAGALFRGSAQNTTGAQPVAVSQPALSNSGLLSRRQDRPSLGPAIGSDSLSPPVNNISMPKRPTEAEMEDMLAQQRTQTETPNSELIIAGEGPLTPRNNAGPFVFDGSGSRTGSRRQLVVPDTRSLNELRDGPD